MREIKFRAWNKATKTMHYPDWDELAVRARLAEMELMQYTGLKDKNKKEIYEGDIVEISMPGFGICENRLVEWIGSGWNSMGEDYHREVISNIYENPELINS